MELCFDNGWGRGELFLDRINDLFSETGSNGGVKLVPVADIVEDHDGYHFSLEMPGLTNGSIDVQVEDEMLIVTAERKQPERAKDIRVHNAERRYGQLRRAFQLPTDAGHEAIKASYKDGVLDVWVPKRPEAKPVKIQVDHNNN